MVHTMLVVKCLILLMSVHNLCTLKTFVREDFLSPNFDWSQLDIEEQFFRTNEECPFVKEEVTVFKFLMLDRKGKPYNNTLTLAKGHEVDIRRFYDNTNPDNTGENFNKTNKKGGAEFCLAKIQVLLSLILNRNNLNA